MTFPLGSLRSDGAASGGCLDAGSALPGSARGAAPGSPAAGWRAQLGLLAGAVLWLLAVLALATHSNGDPGFPRPG